MPLHALSQVLHLKPLARKVANDENNKGGDSGIEFVEVDSVDKKAKNEQVVRVLKSKGIVTKAN